MLNSFADKTYALFPTSNNKKIISMLDDSGARVIKLPSPEAEIILDAVSIETLNELVNFDWIIFTDVLTVDFFLQLLEENEIDFFDLDETRVCAFGEVVSDRLRFAQLHADVIPNMLDATAILSALENYVADGKLENLRFLLPKESNSEGEITNELTKAGGKVYELPVYEMKISGEAEIPKLKALLKGGAIDEFIASAPTDFMALKRIFNGESMAEILADIKVSAVDGLIFQYAREHGLKNVGLFQLDKIDKV